MCFSPEPYCPHFDLAYWNARFWAHLSGLPGFPHPLLGFEVHAAHLIMFLGTPNPVGFLTVLAMSTNLTFGLGPPVNP